MFTGIIEKQGKVLSNQIVGGVSRLVIASDLTQIQAGESIAVNGVCLTLLPMEGSDLHFDVSPETLRLTTLGCLVPGDLVNLERAMQATARFGGHYVSGHVDASAEVLSIIKISDCIEMKFAGFALQSTPYLIPKGSITVDGVSLTINTVDDQTITVMLVPHTLANSTLGSLKVGQPVNIEFDYLTRIVAHQLQLIGKVNNEVAL